MHRDTSFDGEDQRGTTINTHNLKIGLGWLGELNTNQIGMLWREGVSIRTIQRDLAVLRRERSLVRRRWGKKRASRPDGTPISQPSLWSLSPAGYKDVCDEPSFPPTYLPPRALRSVPHDVMTSECLVRMIVLWRNRPDKYLSGVYIEREVRLDPNARKPITDALIMVRFSRIPFPRQGVVPWTKDRPSTAEKRVRYAIENDRGSETLSVIAGKAVSYEHINTTHWRTHYGGTPLPVWLVPSESRLLNILGTWYHAWRDGEWHMTTDSWMQGDCWLIYKKGAVSLRGLVLPKPTFPVDAMGKVQKPFGGRWSTTIDDPDGRPQGQLRCELSRDDTCVTVHYQDRRQPYPPTIRTACFANAQAAWSRFLTILMQVRSHTLHKERIDITALMDRLGMKAIESWEGGPQ